jgi:hypothetical protein
VVVVVVVVFAIVSEGCAGVRGRIVPLELSSAPKWANAAAMATRWQRPLLRRPRSLAASANLTRSHNITTMAITAIIAIIIIIISEVGHAPKY